jgi:hypothetical protein
MQSANKTVRENACSAATDKETISRNSKRLEVFLNTGTETDLETLYHTDG